MEAIAGYLVGGKGDRRPHCGNGGWNSLVGNRMDIRVLFCLAFAAAGQVLGGRSFGSPAPRRGGRQAVQRPVQSVRSGAMRSHGPAWCPAALPGWNSGRRANPRRRSGWEGSRTGVEAITDWPRGRGVGSTTRGHGAVGSTAAEPNARASGGGFRWSPFGVLHVAGGHLVGVCVRAGAGGARGAGVRGADLLGWITRTEGPRRT